MVTWKPLTWTRTTIDEDEIERQRIKAILAKLPDGDDDQDDDDQDEDTDGVSHDAEVEV